jgi:RNA polymerase sigma factor for flagellar operon FliA
MVNAIVQKVISYVKPPLSLDDLISAGTIGLLKAARDYDPKHQAEFKTYAYIKIKGAILDELRKFNILPSQVNKLVKKTVETSNKIYSNTGCLPQDDTLAKKLDISIDELRQIQKNARTLSFISIENPSENNYSLANFLTAAQLAPEHNLEKKELIDKLTNAIKSLPEKQKQVVLLYYLRQLNMKQVAQVLDITESRVSQIHATAIFNLSVKMGVTYNA